MVKLENIGPTPFSPGVFTAGSGEFLRETITYGCTNSPAGLAYQTTREVKIRNAVDSIVLQETQVYTGASYERAGWTIYNYDDIGRLTNKWHSNGLYEEQTWSGFQKTTSMNDEGIEKIYTYDEFGEIASETRLGVAAAGECPAVPDLITVYNRDAMGRVESMKQSSGSYSQGGGKIYDMVGRLITSVDSFGLTTKWSYAEGGRIATKTLPGGAIEVTTKYRDGRMCSITGTAVTDRYYDYGANADGTQWRMVYTGEANSPQWERTVYDMFGRKIRIENPTINGGIGTNVFEYDNLGQLVRVAFSGKSPVLYTYNAIGTRIRQGIDVDHSGTLDPISNDRITDFEKSYVLDDGDWYQQSLKKNYPESLDDFCITQSLSRIAMSGSGCACLAKQRIEQDLHGNVVETVVDVDPDSKRVTRTMISTFSTNFAVQLAVNGLVFSTESETGIKWQYRYDALGRRIQDINPRTGTNITHYDTNGRVDYIEDAARNRTSYTYDSLTGRPIAVTDALTNSVYTEYDKQGRVIGTWGATYPVLYDYDDVGRMIAMYTLRADAVNTNTSYDGFRSQIANFDKTMWEYDPATGLLTNKLYADGNGTAYSYTQNGRLATRTWARGITTYYSYDALGNLTNISYSDGTTPSITYTYGRLGNKETVTDVLGTRVLKYNDAIQLISDSNVYGVVEYNVDALGRPYGVSIGDHYAVTYEYDDIGRFVAVTSSITGTFRYQYVPDSDLIAGLSNGDFCVNYSYEPHRSLKTLVQNSYSNELISEYSYIYDALGRRTAVQNGGQAFAIVTNAFNLYDYNVRSELVGAARYLGTNIADTTRLVTNEMYNYSYDPIGNRQEAFEEGLTPSTYAVNELNQYLLITSVVEQIVLSYDMDGNLTNDGQNAYYWNGENRLVKVEPIVLTNGSRKIENAYDYMGRRVRKRVYSRESDSWVLDTEHRFVYDGWNMIAEKLVSGIDTQVSYYIWGLDLSRTIQGAGGVGGMLASSKQDVYFCAYDANGNVQQLVGESGSIDARYEYGPYGENAILMGSDATNNKFRFSTKYFDEDSALYLYGHRFFSVKHGRWLRRDPQEPLREVNLYCYIKNSPINSIDPLGLEEWVKLDCYFMMIDWQWENYGPDDAVEGCEYDIDDEQYDLREEDIIHDDEIITCSSSDIGEGFCKYTIIQTFYDVYIGVLQICSWSVDWTYECECEETSSGSNNHTVYNEVMYDPAIREEVRTKKYSVIGPCDGPPLPCCVPEGNEGN